MGQETKTATEIAAELEKKLEAAEKEAKSAKEAVEELKKTSATAEELKKATDDLTKTKEVVETLSGRIQVLSAEKKDGEMPEQTLCDAIETVLKSDNFKLGKTHEVKADTTNIVTPITNAQVIPGVNMPRTRALAFMPNFTLRTVAKDKDTIVWLEGEYASNIGYVSEGIAQGTEDTVQAVEKSRKLAKISAVIKVTAEMYEDKSYIAQMLESEMYKKAMLWFDKELLNGAGTDEDGKNNKIYGLKTHATAFDVAKAGIATAIAKPTIADLAGAIKLQGSVIDASKQSDKGDFNIDLLYINPIDAMKWCHEKDANGQYLLTKLSDGSQVMGGLRVVETTAIAANTMLGMESGLAELWLKRNFEIKAGQEGNDMSNDQYTIVLFMRGQSLVKTIDKGGVVYVADVTAALTALSKTNA